MALTDAEIVECKRHLGMNSAAQALYPIMPTFFAALDVLTTLPAATEDGVRTILGRLADIEVTLNDATNINLAASAVGSVRLREDQVDRLWLEIRRWRRELSTLTGIPIIPAGGSGILVV